MVKLGRVDIFCEVSMISSCLDLPREGHLKQLFHMFAYLEKNHNAEIVFDPTVSDIDMKSFPKEDWSKTIYANERGELKEDIPTNLPTPYGKTMKMRVFVDSDHAGDQVTKRSRTGFLVFLNQELIYWSSKKQIPIETPSFRSEYMALKHDTEYIRGLRYKLRLMGILVNECTYIYSDIQSVLCNTTTPHSQLKKKSNSVAYHHVQEELALDEWRTTYIRTDDNASNLMTKALPPGEKRTKFCKILLHFLGSWSELWE